MVRRTLLSMGMAVALVAIASWGFAGDFHAGIKLICSDCHVMHYSQSHGYAPNGGGLIADLGGGPNHYLLRNDINELCLSCHDNQVWAPDVFEEHGNGYIRQAGGLNEVGGGSPYFPTTGHTLNSTDTAPGSDPAWSNPDGMNCVDCHAAHGSGTAGNSFRNLGGFGTAVGSGTAISYTRGDVEGSNPLTAWVHEDISIGTSAAHYGVGALAFNEPVPTASAYADFCKGCHTNFHGDVGGAEVGGIGDPPEEFVRHPNSTVNIGAIGGGHSRLTDRFATKVNQVQVMSPAGKKAGSYTATDTDLSPSCMSCHKGHGNKNAFGLIYMLGTGTIDEEGDDGIDARNLCRQCHGQGGSDATF